MALRWIRDYWAEKTTDRSIFSAWQDFHYVDDALVGVDAETDQAFVTEDNHFVRAVKVTVGSGFNVEVANSELTKVTGIEDTDGLTPTP